MKIDFLKELQWRGLVHDMTPGLEAHLQSGVVRGYIGFDPTAPSLTIGNYVQLMLLTFLQRAGHQPVILLGGATGRIGDPSGKDKERELKSFDELDRNTAFQLEQFRKYMDFSADKPNPAIVVNNLDFYREMSFLDFLRDIGKNLTVNYMMSKESVQKRLETGISFTEFSYQLLQGYDFVKLNRDFGVTLQMGGSDQYGNITAGIELSRKMSETKVFAVTTPLLTKKDGEKFGKSNKGNIWLDPERTSPYAFYQFWLNADDDDMPKFFRYFSLKSQAEIEEIEATQDIQNQKRIFAEEITMRIHGAEAYQAALDVSKLLFDPKASREMLLNMDLKYLEEIAGEIPSPVVSAADLNAGIGILDFLSEKTGILASNTEVRNAIKNNAISINKQKITEHTATVGTADLLHGRFLMVENGKKNKYLVQIGA